MLSVYKEVISAIAEKVKKDEFESPVLINVREMPSEGLAKIRYIGAWSVAKVLHSKLNFVRKNMATTSKKTMESVHQALTICNIVEEHIAANIEELQESSNYPETLTLTENRQYRSR